MFIVVFLHREVFLRVVRFLFLPPQKLTCDSEIPIPSVGCVQLTEYF